MPINDIHLNGLMTQRNGKMQIFIVYCSTMRIIAGSKRGMKLLSPKTDVSRPITDRVKEALFNVLYKYDLPAGKRIADLFSGVGSLGLEALSRKAEFVTFVEKNPNIITVLKKNIEKTGFIKQSNVTRADAFKLATFTDINQHRYDLVFVDPPYSTTKDASVDSRLGGLLRVLQQQITTDGVVVVRTDKSTELARKYELLETIERRTWGSMAVTILRQTNNDK